MASSKMGEGETANFCIVRCEGTFEDCGVGTLRGFLGVGSGLSAVRLRRAGPNEK